jgi:hypothetical protein
VFRASGRNSKIVAESFLVKIIDKHYADKWKQLAVSNGDAFIVSGRGSLSTGALAVKLPFRASGQNSKLVAKSFLLEITDNCYAYTWNQPPVHNGGEFNRFLSGRMGSRSGALYT